MPDIMAIAEVGINTSLRQLDTISRNVANSNTQGYKREIYLNRGFSTLLPAQEPSGVPTPPAAQRDLAAGSMKYTGSALNLAIEGHGYFQLRSPQGVLLTRDGQFQINEHGELVSAEGYPVLLRGGITLENTSFQVQGDGTLTAGDSQSQIDLVDAAPENLQAVGTNHFIASTTAPLASGAGRVRQGYLEMSNVNTLTEMVDMLGVVRRVEASQQLLRAYDEILDNAISNLGQF